MRFPVKHLLERAPERPEGYIEEVLSLGRIEGQELVMEDQTYADLKARYATHPPGPGQLLRNLAASSDRWVEAGCPVISSAGLERRRGICHACEHWNPSALFGLGRCGHPDCGCSVLKLVWATEKCPLTPPRWEAEA